MSSTASIPETMSFAKPTGIGPAFAVGFFFALRVIIELVWVRVLGVDSRTGSELSLAMGFLLLGFVYFYTLGACNRTFVSMFRLASIRWVGIFLVFSCCSLAWSGTALLPAAIAYWCGMAADVAMVALLLRAEPPTGVASSLMKGFIACACLTALIAWIMPAQYDLRLGEDEFFNPNSIGNLCAFGFFMAQYLARRKDGKWGLVSTFLAVTLLRSLSKTTIAAFVVSAGFLVVQDASMSRKTKMLLTTAAVLIVVAFWGLLESYYVVYTNAGNQAETITGRIGIWAYMLNGALEQPWIGHGFDSVWKVIPPFGEFEARHAENELLQQFYAYGAAGICMLAGLYASLYRQLRRLPRGPLKVIFISMLLFAVVRGFAEAEPFDLLLPLWLIVLISPLADEVRDRSSLELQEGTEPDRELAAKPADVLSPAG